MSEQPRGTTIRRQQAIKTLNDRVVTVAKQRLKHEGVLSVREALKKLEEDFPQHYDQLGKKHRTRTTRHFGMPS